jgi:putative redox protein
MTIHVSTDKGLRMVIRSHSHTWYADEPVSDGGTDTAADPNEQLLGALGSCMAITVQMYANRKQWPLEKIEVELDLRRFNGADYPAYKGDAHFVHEIREKIVLHGPLTDEQRVRLMEISTKCPVRRVLVNPTFFVEAENTTVSS